MAGWVYVITNAAMPGLVKVGYTDRDPGLRAAELAATGVPIPYVVDYAVQVVNPRLVEARAHALLKDSHAGKEWFHCARSAAREAVDQAAGAELIGEWGGVEATNIDSPLVPGHALESFYTPAGAGRQLRNSAKREEQDSEDDDSGPLPPGHPSRGLI